MRPLAARSCGRNACVYVHHAEEVDRHDVLPVLKEGVGIAGEGIAPVDAGVVHEDRHAAHFRFNFLCHGDAVVAAGDVEHVACRLAARGLDLGRGHGRRLAIDVEHDDLCALGRVSCRDGAADA